MFVGVLVIEIMIYSSTSLKEKRIVLKSVKDRLRNKFNVAVSETGFQDKWQRAELGIVTISNQQSHLETPCNKYFNILIAQIHMKLLHMNSITYNMQENNRRSQRVASQIKTEISWLIEHKLRDPDKGFVTVTKVRLSTDLKIASIYYSVLGTDQERDASEEALNRAKSFLKHELGNRIHLRVIPELRFFYDDSLDYSDKISTLLRKIKKDESD